MAQFVAKSLAHLLIHSLRACPLKMTLPSNLQPLLSKGEVDQALSKFSIAKKGVTRAKIFGGFDKVFEDHKNDKFLEKATIHL